MCSNDVVVITSDKDNSIEVIKQQMKDKGIEAVIIPPEDIIKVAEEPAKPTRILIVEDDSTTRDIIKRLIKRLIAVGLPTVIATPCKVPHNDVYFDSELINEQKRIHKNSFNSFIDLEKRHDWRGGNKKKGGRTGYRRR